MTGSIFFLSDTHFKYHSKTEDERRKRWNFREFLAGIGGAARLYLVGDIFDFWFEYKSVVPRYYQDILDGLMTLRRTGTRIYMTGGNHDAWLGSYLKESLDFEILSSLVTHELQGRKVTITHGDMLPPGDYAYKVLKRIIRSGSVVRLASAVHPDLLYAFASRFSKASKEITHQKTLRSARAIIESARERCFRWENDVFVMGHIHYPTLEHVDSKVLVILGDWERHFSYLRLEDGRLSLSFYNSGEKTVIENR